MIAALYLIGPFAVAALAAAARRRAGAWASWLILIASAYLFVRLDIREVFWNEPRKLAGLDEAFGAMCAAAVMALLLQSFGRVRPSLLVQVMTAGLAGLAVQWGYAAASPDFRGGPTIPVFLGAWALALVVREVRRRLQAEHSHKSRADHRTSSRKARIR